MASSGAAATSASQSDGISSRMEGWLYLIRFNRIGLQFSRKRYFVLDGNLLRSFKSVPVSNNQARLYSSSSFFFFLFHRFSIFFFISNCVDSAANGGREIAELSVFVLLYRLWRCETFFLELSSQDPVRSAIVDSCIRVMDNGRESVNRKVSTLFFCFLMSLIFCVVTDGLLVACVRDAHSLCWLQVFFIFTLYNTLNHNDQLKVRSLLGSE